MPTFRIIACSTEGCGNQWQSSPDLQSLELCINKSTRQGWKIVSGIGAICPHCCQTTKAWPEPVPKDPVKECRSLLRDVAHALAGMGGNATYSQLSEVFSDIGQEPF